MKIEHYKIIATIKVIQSLGDKELPSKVSFELFKLRRLLSPFWDFQAEQEQKILNKYGKDDGHGAVRLTEEGNKAMSAMLAELNMQEEEIDFNPIRMKIPDVDMTVDQFEILSNFIEFTEK